MADPGQIDVGGKFAGALSMMGLSAEALAKLPELAPEDERKVMTTVNGDRSLAWKLSDLVRDMCRICRESASEREECQNNSMISCTRRHPR